MSKKLKRATTLAAVLAISALALSGCAKQNDAGGGTKSAPAGSAKVAFVPKLQGIPFFEAMNRGGQAAGKEFGFEWIYKGATTADPAAQADVVRSLIQQKVSTLIVAPNDPDSMAPLLKEAQDKGIHVMTADTDAPASVREVFVNQATAPALGEALAEQMAKAMGDKGSFAIVSCGKTAANLNSWIDEVKRVLPEKHPQMKLVDVVYADEDQDKAVTMAKNLISAHPDLTGLMGPCTTAAPGIAQAVTETNKIGKVFTVGVGTPKAMTPYLKSGSSSASVLWDVENAGYLAGWAGAQLATKKTFEATNKVGRIGDVEYLPAQKMLVLGKPLILTKENVEKYNY